MYIEELIIDGFKSYAVRTHISGWDPEFNAITGLNGSGKSNILDAICFVLGITNLSQVRANNLQDLIYKRGQAGITKASVTLVFNNDDRERSPVGFEDYSQITVTRQVLLGGKGKYLVNGHNAPQQNVQSLFQSVQLNINNPHFLIMQGRITKVLNMKPAEILGVIEEAAGTKMFEDRKNKALATMAKKEKKVEEITTILTEEISPKLDQLRAEKRAYVDYRTTESEMERLSRLLIAYEYKKTVDKLSRSGAGYEEKKQRIVDLTANIDQLKTQITHIDEEIRKYTLRRDKELGSGGKFQKLENALKEFSKQLVLLKTQCDLKATSIAEEEKNLEASNATRIETESSLKYKKKQYTEHEAKFDVFKKGYDAKSDELRKNEELLQTLVTGVSAQEGHENGYMEQLQEAKNIASQATTEEEQAKLKIAHLNKELKEKQPLAIKAEKDNRGLLNELETAKKVVRDLQARLSKIDWDPNHETELLRRKSVEQDAIMRLSEQSEALASQLSSLEFQYSDPIPKFNRSNVKGLVVELIDIDNEHIDASTALEVCAGGRLYNVVVTTEVIGSQLLQNGKLRKRVTIIPLNKVQASRAPKEKIVHAQKIAPGKVDLALDLIGYDEEVQTAMEFVFGNTLITKDSESAKRVTFEKNIRMRSVTFDGDVYDPSGTLSGGSKPNSTGLLVKLQQLKGVRTELQVHKQALDTINKEIQSSQKVMTEYNKFKQQLDLKLHEVGLLEEQITKSTYAQLVHQVEDIQHQIKEQEGITESVRAKRKAATAECERIESEMKDFKNNKDSKLKELKNKIATSKTELSNNAQKVKDMQREVQTLKLEIEQLESDMISNQTEISNLKDLIAQYQKEESHLSKELLRTKEGLDETQTELQTERQKLSAYDEEIRELETAAKEKGNEIAETKLEIQQINHEVERYEKETQVARQSVKNMEKEHDWIADQRQNFGQPNTPFDFSNVNFQDASKTYEKLKDKYESMRKKINEKVMNMIDNVEKKEASLKTMLTTVQKDKSKIEDTIVSLDNYKKDALEKTWAKVDADFGGIFGDLLPGNTAKLQPPENQSISDGLEVKVCLGGIWKQSLTELSGGQRSLIALSLILSLLQFKPAPMYILDEVDAALDLSHTQNIGQLLRTRFKGSQFIVVSLKEGMFNNANVLFRARFKDGTSVVERIAQSKVDSATQQAKGKENTPSKTTKRPQKRSRGDGDPESNT